MLLFKECLEKASNDLNPYVKSLAIDKLKTIEQK